VKVAEIDIAEYAIRYCMSRSTYAFCDGLDLAEHHWRQLSRATRDDVLTATRVHGFPMNDAPTRWPNIYRNRYPGPTKGAT
jgi:hypothetical protein